MRYSSLLGIDPRNGFSPFADRHPFIGEVFQQVEALCLELGGANGLHTGHYDRSFAPPWLSLPARIDAGGDRADLGVCVEPQRVQGRSQGGWTVAVDGEHRLYFQAG